VEAGEHVAYLGRSVLLDACAEGEVCPGGRQQGVGEGDWMVIETPRGKIKQKAKLTSRMPPRMIEAQHGWWFPEEIAEDPVL